MNPTTVFGHAASAFALLLLFTTPASAQQVRVQGGDFRNRTVQDETLNRASRFELGLNLAGSLSFGTVTPDGGASRNQTNVYFSPALVGGYMITDNFELRIALGMQYVGQDVDGTEAITNLAGTAALQGLYQHDLMLGIALYGGVGLGGFYGSRTEEIPGGLERRFDSAGGIGQLMAGLLMMPGPMVLFRGGLRADFIFGWDTPSDGVGPGASFFTTQILFEVAIGLRFG